MPPLSILLRVNAASCIAFGVVFTAFPSSTVEFVGSPPIWLVFVVGLGLLFNGSHLIIASTRKEPNLREVYYFSAGDVVWALATLVLTATGNFITTGPGIVVALLVAACVAAIGLMQVQAVQA